jgi:hypothetical protein
MYFILVKTIYSPPLAGVLDPTDGQLNLVDFNDNNVALDTC